MKSLKVLLVAALLGGSFVTSSLLAQPPEGGKKGGGRGRGPTIETIETAVGTLTAEQKTKITAILTKLQETMAAVPQEERQTKGQELRTAAMKEVRALLTPEQQTKFDAMPQGGGRGQGGKKGN